MRFRIDDEEMLKIIYKNDDLLHQGAKTEVIAILDHYEEIKEMFSYTLRFCLVTIFIKHCNLWCQRI